MNKKVSFISILSVSLGLIIPLSLVSLNNHDLLSQGVSSPSCENYWSDSSFTSLYDLTKLTSFSSSGYTTWGTVAKCYTNSSDNYSMFIQSKDQSGHVAGALLYNFPSSLAENTLVEVSGTPTWWYGQLRFTNSSTYTVKSANWYTPLASEMTFSDWSDDNSSTNWATAVNYGARKTILKNVTVGTAGSTQTSVTFPSSTTTACLYYNDVNSTTKSAIKSALSSYSGQAVDVTGYLQCFINGAGTTTTMELQMTDENGIVATGGSTTISVTGVSLDETSLSMSTASPATLTATISPSNATNTNVTWDSNDTTVATVSDGVITGLKSGSTTITVTTEDGSFTATCQVSVTSGNIAVTDVSLNQNSMSMYVGDNASLTATIAPSTATNKNVTWTSSNTNVATINNGAISALSAGNSTITVTSSDGGFTATCVLTVSENETLSEITLSSSSLGASFSYTTNFGIKSVSGYSFSYYRAGYSSSNLAILYSTNSFVYGYNSMEGAIFNNDPINGIKKVTVTYKSTSGIKVSYGVTKSRGYSQSMAASSSSTTTTISCSVASCYFAVETNGGTATITSIVIGYNSSLTTNTTTTNTSDKRIAPTVFSGTLVDGVSSISVPNDVTISGNTYTINSSKTYTYYSYDYCSSHSSVLTAAAMTDPVDVSNYYIAFGKIPANYGASSSISGSATTSQVDSLFGDNARVISYYTRTDGYATSVPYNSAKYYEFDINIDGTYATSSSKRGTGRVVMWIDGWSCYSDGASVATYSDDHYATFSEYLNDGLFGTRFDAQASSTGYRSGYAMPSTGSTQLSLA